MGEEKDSKDRRHVWRDSRRGWFHWREFQNYLEGEARKKRDGEEKQPQTRSLVAWVEFGAHVVEVGSLGIRCWNVGQPGDTPAMPACKMTRISKTSLGQLEEKILLKKKVKALSELSTLGRQLLLI